MRRSIETLTVLLVGVVVGGCTTGNRWVQGPENGSPCTLEFCNDAAYDTRVDDDSWVHETVEANRPQPASEPARQRIDHTISLGKVWDDSEPRAAAPAYVAYPPDYPDYGGWYGGWVGGWGGVRGGHDRFGSVRSFGPPFPFSTAPASPWAPAASGPRMGGSRRR